MIPFSQWKLGARLALFGLLAGAMIAMIAGIYLTGRDHGRAKERLEAAQAAQEALAAARVADGAAASEMASDDARIDKQETIYADAIERAPAGVPSAAAVALACERLRRQHPSRADLPAACAGRGTDGGEAGPD